MSDDTRSFDDVQAEVTGDDHGETHRHSENIGKSSLPTETIAQEAYESVYAARDETPPKHTTGTIDGHSFSLRVDGDAPEALVARIEAALADVKAEQNKTKPTGTEWICPHCGDTMSLQEACEPWPCTVCGEQMVLRDTSGVTPNDELQALVDRLQSVEGKNDILSEVSHYPERGRTEYVYCTVDAVVSELEALLDDTQDNE